MDLIMLANHKPGHIRIQGVRVDVLRGEVGWSEVALAARWRWSRGKVRRFMQELEDEKMLTKKRYTGQDKRNCLSTIVNYEKFQGEDFADDTSDSTGDGHATDMRRYTNKNEKNEKKNINTPTTPETGAVVTEKTHGKTDRPAQCPAETWEHYLRISRGFHSDKATQLGARAPLTDAKVLDGAKALDNLIRIKGRPEDEVLAVLGWSIDDPFWSVNLRSIKALLKTSNSNGEMKYSNVLTSMTRDLERRAERSMVANG